MAGLTGKNAKNPNRTGMRCIICYAWEIKTPTISKPNLTSLEHESYCPDYNTKKDIKSGT